MYRATLASAVARDSHLDSIRVRLATSAVPSVTKLTKLNEFLLQGVHTPPFASSDRGLASSASDLARTRSKIRDLSGKFQELVASIVSGAAARTSSFSFSSSSSADLTSRLVALPFRPRSVCYKSRFQLSSQPAANRIPHLAARSSSSPSERRTQASTIYARQLLQRRARVDRTRRSERRGSDLASAQFWSGFQRMVFWFLGRGIASSLRCAHLASRELV